MDETSNRECLRLSIPQDSILTLAIWLTPRQRPSRITLAELGRPSLMRSQGKSRGIDVDDISANGIRLGLSGPALSRLAGQRSQSMFIYLKLPDLDPSESREILSLFLQAEIVHDVEDQERRHLAGKFVQRGLPSSTDKALEFVNAEKYGVSELSKWIEEVSRPVPEDEFVRETPGLDLDQLIEELAAALAQDPLNGQVNKPT